LRENSSLLPDTNNSNYILLSENEPLRPSHELTEIIEYQEENSTRDITPTTITEVEEDITDIENSWTTLTKEDEIIETAKNFLGTKYVWAANGPDCFDCSGFTKYVY